MFGVEVGTTRVKAYNFKQLIRDPFSVECVHNRLQLRRQILKNTRYILVHFVALGYK
jgi:hypothetical protein